MKVEFQRNFKNFFINFEEDEIDQSIASQFNGSLADQALWLVQFQLFLHL